VIIFHVVYKGAIDWVEASYTSDINDKGYVLTKKLLIANGKYIAGEYKTGL